MRKKHYFSFVLSMPNVGSWNGKWTGASRLYARARGYTDPALVERLLAKRYYHYNFGDGWSAGIDVREVDSKEAARIKRKSDGFCGYDWMIDSIVDHGDIRISEGRQ